MLTILPNEIIIAILSHLSKQDLSQCSLVCKSVHPLSQAALFKSVYFNKGTIQLALQFFRTNEKIAQYVHHAELATANHLTSTQLIPFTLANLRSLELYDLIDTAESFIIKKSRCSATLKSLLVHEAGRTSFTIALLQSATYTALRSLKLDSWTIRLMPATESQKRLQELLACFDNTPALEEVQLTNVQLYDDDLDQLHRSLPCLKRLSLEAGFYYNNGYMDPTPVTSNHSTIINHLEEFRLILFSDHLASYGLYRLMGRHLMRYLHYTHRNYHELSSLKLHVVPFDKTEDRDVARHLSLDFDQLQQLMRHIIHHLEDVRLMECELFPFTEQNVDACEKHQLKSVSIWDVLMGIDTQIANLCNSTLVNSINNVCLYTSTWAPYYQVDVWRRMLVDHELTHLTNLEINGAHSLGQQIPAFLLQQLPHLEALSLNAIHATSDYMPTIDPARLVILSIGYYLGAGLLELTNRFLEAVLTACPLLEHFDMRLVIDSPGQIQARIVFNLKDHCRYLKSFDLLCPPHPTILLLNNDPQHPRYWSSMTQERKAPTERENYILVDVHWNPRARVDIRREEILHDSFYKCWV